MVERSEQDRLLRSGGERLLMVALASALWAFLSFTKILPPAEAILLGWTVGFLVGYWLPPRPTIGFFRWASERIILLWVFYALVLKTPTLFAPSLNVYVAHGIAFIIFLAIYFAWTRHPNSTLRLGRA
jgi:hypothetical protein